VPRVGRMWLIDSLPTANDVEHVAMHEIGHMLGIGTIWQDNVNANTFTYTGGEGRRGSVAIGGPDPPPVENDGSASVARAHWEESVYRDELMTPYLTGSTQPASMLTIGALRDLGYTIPDSAAEVFSLSGRRRRRLRGKNVLVAVAWAHTHLVKYEITILNSTAGQDE
jgi:hypothetical protein